VRGVWSVGGVLLGAAHPLGVKAFERLHTGEAAPAQPVTENHRLGAAELGERNVAVAGVPPIPGPFGLTVSDQHQARTAPE
jgi:hypothetical protein